MGRSKWTSVITGAVRCILSLVLLTGCYHRGFDYADEDLQTAYLNVVFDWVNEPDANPESMSLYLFPTDGREPIRHEFTGRDGGEIRVTVGTYHAICVNSDNRDVFFRNRSEHSTFEVTTSEVQTLSLNSSLRVNSLELPRASGTEDQTIMNQPPLLWAASTTDIKVDYTPASKSRARSSIADLRMYPSRIVDTYCVTVNNISNIQSLQSLTATISDLADGYLPASGAPNENIATISLDLTHNKETTSARGTFLTFGHCPTDVRSHKMMLYAILSDGSKYYYEFDVSEQAHQGAADDNIHYITIDSLDLPEADESGESGGGLSPSVSDWQTIDINISM